MSNFLANQLDEVITDIGVDNFSAIVSDHASACAAAKRIISERYKHILSIRCIAHHVNLISTDICKTIFAKEVISKCQKIVKYFKQSHQAGEELREKITNEIKGGGLKTYVITRWTTAWDQCCHRDGTGTWTGQDGTVHGHGQKFFNFQDIGTFISCDHNIYLFTLLLIKKEILIL